MFVLVRFTGDEVTKRALAAVRKPLISSLFFHTYISHIFVHFFSRLFLVFVIRCKKISNIRKRKFGDHAKSRCNVGSFVESFERTKKESRGSDPPPRTRNAAVDLKRCFHTRANFARKRERTRFRAAKAYRR